MPQPYEQLAAVYDRMGHDEDARNVRIAKQQAEREWGKLSRMRWFQNWLLDWTIKYGWLPWRAVGFGLAMILFGALLFFLADFFGGMRATTAVKWIPLQWFFFSVDSYLPIVDLGQESRWAPDVGAAWWVWLIQIYLWLHILFGWAVATMATLAFSGLVQQK